jgi:hypothetical protein
MSGERTVNKMFKNIPEGKMSVGKPNDVENDLHRC